MDTSIRFFAYSSMKDVMCGKKTCNDVSCVFYTRKVMMSLLVFTAVNIDLAVHALWMPLW